MTTAWRCCNTNMKLLFVVKSISTTLTKQQQQKIIQPNLPSQIYETKSNQPKQFYPNKPHLWNQTYQSNFSNQIYQTNKPSRPNLLNQSLQTKLSKPNLPTELTQKIILIIPNKHTYQTKLSDSNIPNQTFQNKPTKSKLANQTLPNQPKNLVTKLIKQNLPH